MQPDGGTRGDGKIDRTKLRAAIQNLKHEHRFYMLDKAIDLLSEDQLAKVAGQYLRLDVLRERIPVVKESILTDVQSFEKRSRAGEYHQSFNVNSKNFMEKSVKTCAWIAQFERLMDRCIGAKDLPPAQLRKILETLFGLLRRIDQGEDDIIFFADEGGSWQVGVDWDNVFPCWFTTLAATATPVEFAREVLSVVNEFESFNRDNHLEAAERVATPDQRKALQKARFTSSKSRTTS